MILHTLLFTENACFFYADHVKYDEFMFKGTEY